MRERRRFSPEPWQPNRTDQRHQSAATRHSSACQRRRFLSRLAIMPETLRSASPSDPLILHLSAGSVRGLLIGDVRRYLGVPYAAPPVGPLRFAAPQPVLPWSGVRDATERGLIAPQPVPTPE